MNRAKLYVPLFKASGDGHRYFREKEKVSDLILRSGDSEWCDTGNIAVADNSGRTPPQTEDGVLYLDTSEDLRWEANLVSIPLRRLNGDRAWTGETFAGGVEIARYFGMRIVVSHGARKYRVDLTEIAD